MVLRIFPSILFYLHLIIRKPCTHTPQLGKFVLKSFEGNWLRLSKVSSSQGKFWYLKGPNDSPLFSGSALGEILTRGSYLKRPKKYSKAYLLKSLSHLNQTICEIFFLLIQK